MKRKLKQLQIIVITSLFTIVTSCGGGGGDDSPPSPPPPINKAPNTPSLSTPTNNKLCIDNSVDFSWKASTDPENDAINYKIEIATDNQFTAIVESITISSTSTNFSLDKGVAYYWRVKATDIKNNSSSYSATYSFYTEGEGISNHLPFSPSLIAPTMNQLITETSITLEWDASDVDGDDLIYDIYLDTFNPPTTKVSENQTEKMFLTDLESSKVYYWKVHVKDIKNDKGGITKGPIWKFRTD